MSTLRTALRFGFDDGYKCACESHSAGRPVDAVQPRTLEYVVKTLSECGISARKAEFWFEAYQHGFSQGVAKKRAEIARFAQA